MEAISLYIHIPFCVQKCAYCDFQSAPCSNQEKDRYVEGLIQEIHLQGKAYGRPQVYTVFFGGGTPSLLQIHHIEGIGQALKQAFDLSVCKEFTFEANPGTLNLENLEAWHDIGANRVSMGVQVMDNRLLQLIGRIHSVEEVVASVQMIREAGFTNYNLDMMFGIPTQTLEDVDKTLGALLDLEPNHISAYSLKLEEGTQLNRLVDQGLLHEVSEDLDRDMYQLVIDRLTAAGLPQYEISNFARPGRESKHNIVYWENKPYLGLGIAAHGCIRGERIANEVSTTKWLERIQNGDLPIVDRESISPEMEAFETLMLGLRLNKGVDRKSFLDRYQVDIMDLYSQALSKHEAEGLVTITGDRIALTTKGFNVSNQVFVDLMPDE